MVHDNDAKGSRATKETLFGDEVYVADAMPVKARGIGISPERLEVLRTERLQDILTDRPGRDEVDVLFGSLELTAFGAEAVAQILKPLPEEEHSRGWREGEALAEAWLIDAEECEFPWPFNRDLRHPRTSLPGAELVGFTRDSDGDRFVFAQVNMQVPVAPLHEQAALVDAVKQAFARLSALSVAVGSSKTDLDSLNSAILAKAFRGELVPQDTDGRGDPSEETYFGPVGTRTSERDSN